jgi:serine/threonine-protein kinase
MSGPPRSTATQELDPLIGLTVSGRYRVHVLIGQGGMGKVFRAQQIPLGRAVALKVLEASRVDTEFQRRFFREAAILAKLKSRHTVTIYDYGRDNDLYFIAMELVAGGSLAQVLAAEGPLGVTRTLSIAQQICRSLREAHAQGVIHRDLKPGNVVLTQSEEGEELAKVLDFGLAKRVNTNSTEDTDADTVPGSPKYMAPEVIRQQGIDGRTDLYSLGIMMYQMITGAVPFNRDNPMDILIAHLHEPPPSMRDINPHVEIPVPLERVIMRCIAKAPEDRFPDVQSLLDTLRALSVDMGLSTDPSWVGQLAPDPAPSGVRPSVPSLRLQGRDVSGRPPARTQLRRGLTRTGRAALGFGLVGVGAIYAGIAWTRMEDAQPKLPSATPPISIPATPAPAPVLPAAVPTEMPADETKKPAAAPRARAQAVDMVFAPEGDDAVLPVLKLRVTSEPEGALVRLQGQRIGVTPLAFDWRHARARVGGELAIELELAGHAPKTIRRKIEANTMQVFAALEPLADSPAEPAAAEPAPLPVPPASAEEASEAEEGDAVLEIKPIELAGEAEADGEDEPAAENEAEEEEEAPNVLPNPFRDEGQ